MSWQILIIKKLTTKEKSKHKIHYAEPEIEPGTSWTTVGCVISMPSRQMNISIEIKLVIVST